MKSEITGADTSRPVAWVQPPPGVPTLDEVRCLVCERKINEFLSDARNREDVVLACANCEALSCSSACRRSTLALVPAFLPASPLRERLVSHLMNCGSVASGWEKGLEAAMEAAGVFDLHITVAPGGGIVRMNGIAPDSNEFSIGGKPAPIPRAYRREVVYSGKSFGAVLKDLFGQRKL